jgi:hypothetical protein
MDTAVAKLTKENHLNRLIEGLPLLTTLYGVNCLVMYYLMEGVDISSFALSLAFMLTSFIISLFIYDKYHHILLYENYFLIYFQPLQLARKIKYTDIEQIITVDEDIEFSSMRIKLKNKQTISLHFIDYPLQVKQVMTEMMRTHQSSQEAA